LAESHAQKALEAKSASETSAQNAENHLTATTNALTEVQNNAALAESHAQKALEAKSASETSAQSAENNMATTTNALSAVHNNVALAESHAQKALEAKSASETSAQNAENHLTATTNALTAAQNNVALAESHAQKALEAKSASETSAQNAENHLTATTNALTAVQNNVALVEDQAQKALEAKVASQRSVESTESHVAAATNALTAVQSNADTVREKTTEVEQHSAFVKEMVQQMADQASALQATSSAVASASGKAASTLALEAEKQLAMIQEKLTQTEAVRAEIQVQDHPTMLELRKQVEELRSQLPSAVTPSPAYEERLNEVSGDLAESIRITDILSQKIEAVERQFVLELSSHKEDLAQRLERVREVASPKDGEEDRVSQARLEEMISTALERTEHLEQSLVAMTNGHSHSTSKTSNEVAEIHANLQAEINDLKSRSTSCETRLLEELARVSKVIVRPEMQAWKGEVRSVPAALRGMVQSALPVPQDIKNRKALIIGCSYFESNAPLLGAFNDAWNVLSLLRHTLQFSESQVRFLVDGSKSCPMPQPRRPTAAVITESLQWLVQDAQPGDSIFLYYSGYGLLLPHGVGTFESCLVPIDYGAMASPANDLGSGYRLISLMDVSLALAKLPAGCHATVVLDCCHSTLPGLGAKSQPAIFQWAQMQPSAFPGQEEDLPVGLHPKARRLVLPSVPMTGERTMQAATFNCSLTCFSACQQAQWCAELPIEGVMQGAFTFAWVKAVVAHGGSTSQMKGSIEAHLADLKKRFRWLDQKPQVQMSKVVEQQELGRAEVALPDVIRKPLSPNVRRKALIVGINYTGSHARLKGAVNDAWNMYTLLRQSLSLDDDRIRLLVDSDSGNKVSPSQVPSRDNILMNLQWLMEGAQPGDSLVLVFCGFGTQHPKDAEGKEHEAFLVPCDYADDLPSEWWSQVTSPAPPGAQKTVPKAPPNAAYRLISMLELNRFITQVPSGATLTTILDCAYPALPGVSPACNLPPTFPRVQRGRVDYDKMLDFVTRPRFLELPALPVQHTMPQIWKPQTFPTCKLHCFCAGRLQEWPSELPLEGTVQGTFTWAFAKAFAAGELRCTVGQQQQALESITSELKQHFQGVEQSPSLMLSQSASSSDAVFA